MISDVRSQWDNCEMDRKENGPKEDEETGIIL